MTLRTLLTRFCAALAVSLFLAGTAHAHFGMLIPSSSMVDDRKDSKLRLNISFSHPFDSIGMVMFRPKEFKVMVNGKRENLRKTLKRTKVMGRMAWYSDYKIKRPGVYMFYVEPVPYWEAAEETFIVHYTKTVVAAYGDDEGWDGEIGLKTEIVPLTRPFGLYKGNVFQGVVKVDGKPVPHAEVEVEYYNRNRKAKAPSDFMVTQSLKADSKGIFTYAVPKAGWWGFAALSKAEHKMSLKSGLRKDVELGAVIWVQFHDWK